MELVPGLRFAARGRGTGNERGRNVTADAWAVALGVERTDQPPPPVAVIIPPTQLAPVFAGKRTVIGRRVLHGTT